MDECLRWFVHCACGQARSRTGRTAKVEYMPSESLPQKKPIDRERAGPTKRRRIHVSDVGGTLSHPTPPHPIPPHPYPTKHHPVSSPSYPTPHDSLPSPHRLLPSNPFSSFTIALSTLTDKEREGRPQHPEVERRHPVARPPHVREQGQCHQVSRREPPPGGQVPPVAASVLGVSDVEPRLPPPSSVGHLWRRGRVCAWVCCSASTEKKMTK